MDPLLSFGLQALFQSVDPTVPDRAHADGLKAVLAEDPEFVESLFESVTLDRILAVINGKGTDDLVTLGELENVCAAPQDPDPQPVANLANDPGATMPALPLEEKEADAHEADPQERIEGEAVEDPPEAGTDDGDGAEELPLADAGAATALAETQAPAGATARQTNSIANVWVSFLFDLTDEDGAGTIDKDELQSTLKKYPEMIALLQLDRILGDDSLDDAKLEEFTTAIFDEMDEDRSGTIQPDELEAFVEGLSKNSASWGDPTLVAKLIFQLADDDNSGEVSLDELETILRKYPKLLGVFLGKDADPDSVNFEEIFNTADYDGSGSISFKEFQSAFSHLLCASVHDQSTRRVNAKLAKQTRRVRITNFAVAFREAVKELAATHKNDMPLQTRLQMHKSEQEEALARATLLDHFQAKAGIPQTEKAKMIENSVLATRRHGEPKIAKTARAKLQDAVHKTKLANRTTKAMETQSGQLSPDRSKPLSDQGTRRTQKRSQQTPPVPPSYQRAQTWEGPRPGMVFTTGARGLGYYRDSIRSREEAKRVTPETPPPRPSSRRDYPSHETSGAHLDKQIPMPAFCDAIADILPDWWKHMHRSDLIYIWNAFKGDYARFIRELYVSPTESWNVDKNGFSRPASMFSRSRKIGKPTVYKGPFPDPYAIANKMAVGIEEVLEKFSIPRAVQYPPCNSTVMTPLDFLSEDLGHSASIPSRELGLEFIFGYDTGIVGSNLFVTSDFALWVAARTIVMQNLKTSAQKHFFGHRGDITALTLSTKGDFVASGESGRCPRILIWNTSDGALKIWQEKDDEIRRNIKQLGTGILKGQVCALGISPNDRFLVGIGADDAHTFALWSLDTGQLIVTRSASKDTPPAVSGIHWFAPGKLLATGSSKMIKFWKIELGTDGNPDTDPRYCNADDKAAALKGREPPEQYMTSSAFRKEPENKGTLFTGSDTGFVYCWRHGDDKDHDCAYSFQAHAGEIRAMVIDPAGKLYTSGTDGIIYQWSIDVPPEDPEPEDPPLETKDQTFDLWNLLKAQDGEICDLGILGVCEGLPDGVVAALDKFFEIYGHRRVPEDFVVPESNVWPEETWKAGNLGRQELPRSLAVRDMILRESEGQLLIGTLGGLILTLNLADNRLASVCCGHGKGELHGLAVHPTRTDAFVTAGEDGFLSVWDADDHLMVSTRPLSKVPSGIAISPVKGFSEEHLAIGFEDGSVTVLNLGDDFTDPDFDVVREWKHVSDGVEVIKYGPNYHFLACGNRENTILVYNIDLNYDLHCRCEGHSSYITSIDFSLTGELLMSNCAAYQINYWDLAAKGKQIVNLGSEVQWATWTCPLGFGVMGIREPGTLGSEINAVCLSSDSKSLITGEDSGVVKIFNAPCVVKNAPFRPYSGHANCIDDVRFLKQDTYAISIGAKDRCTFLWKVDPKPPENPSAWVGNNGTIADGHGEVMTDESAPVIRTVTCYICGNDSFPDSFIGHLQTCEDKFLKQQEQKDEGDRKPLPPRPSIEVKGLADDGTGEEQIDVDVAQDILDSYNKEAQETFNLLFCIRCEFCARVFPQDRLELHCMSCNVDQSFSALRDPEAEEAIPEKLRHLMRDGIVLEGSLVPRALLKQFSYQRHKPGRIEVGRRVVVDSRRWVVSNGRRGVIESVSVDGMRCVVRLDTTMKPVVQYNTRKFILLSDIQSMKEAEEEGEEEGSVKEGASIQGGKANTTVSKVEDKSAEFDSLPSNLGGRQADVTPPEPLETIRISGAVGEYKSIINGKYSPTGKLMNEKKLFQKQSDHGVWLFFANDHWNVGDAAGKDASNAPEEEDGGDDEENGILYFEAGDQANVPEPKQKSEWPSTGEDDQVLSVENCAGDLVEYDTRIRLRKDEVRDEKIADILTPSSQPVRLLRKDFDVDQEPDASNPDAHQDKPLDMLDALGDSRLSDLQRVSLLKRCFPKVDTFEYDVEGRFVSMRAWMNLAMGVNKTVVAKGSRTRLTARERRKRQDQQIKKAFAEPVLEPPKESSRSKLLRSASKLSTMRALAQSQDAEDLTDDSKLQFISTFERSSHPAQLPVNWVEDLKAKLASFDEDEDGLLSHKDLGKFVQALGHDDLEGGVDYFISAAQGISEEHVNDEGKVTLDGLVAFYEKAAEERPKTVLKNLKKLGLTRVKGKGISDA